MNDMLNVLMVIILLPVLIMLVINGEQPWVIATGGVALGVWLNDLIKETLLGMRNE